MVSRVTLEVVWFPEKSCTAFGSLHISWIPTVVRAMAPLFLLLVLSPCSVRYGGLQESVKLRSALFLPYMCKWHRRELKSKLRDRQQLKHQGCWILCCSRGNIVSKETVRHGLHVLVQMECWDAQSPIWGSDQVAACTGSLELPGHSHCKWGHQLMISWPVSREVITLCCPSSSRNLNQMQLSSLSEAALCSDC